MSRLISHFDIRTRKIDSATLSARLKLPSSSSRIENWNINPSWQILTQKGLTSRAVRPSQTREQRLFLYKIIKILAPFLCKTQSCLSKWCEWLEMVWALARRFVPKPWFSEMCSVNFCPTPFLVSSAWTVLQNIFSMESISHFFAF